MKETKNEHPSYGIISVEKFNGLSEFFGSDIQHSGGITIRISRADSVRKLSNEWVHPKEEIIEIRMSDIQFASLITSGMNTQGVPCTIQHINRERVPQISHVTDKRNMFKGEMQDTQEGYLENIKTLQRKIDATVKDKKVADSLVKELSFLREVISSNSKFVLDQFNETMDKSVADAQQSVNAYIEMRVHELGISALRENLEQNKLIENK